MTTRISAATGNDVPEFLASADALVRADAGSYDAAATNLGWASESGLSYCTSLLDSEDSVVLLARDGDEIIGHLVARLRGPSSVHPIRVADLESIYVYPRHRNHGVGEQLMAAYLSWAAEKGMQRASVTAYAANAGAQRFYARHGFAVKSVILDLDDLPAPASPAP